MALYNSTTEWTERKYFSWSVTNLNSVDCGPDVISLLAWHITGVVLQLEQYVVRLQVGQIGHECVLQYWWSKFEKGLSTLPHKQQLLLGIWSGLGVLIYRIMGESDSEPQCRKQSTSSESISCLNRASFAFITNFENFFFRFVPHFVQMNIVANQNEIWIWWTYTAVLKMSRRPSHHICYTIFCHEAHNGPKTFPIQGYFTCVVCFRHSQEVHECSFCQLPPLLHRKHSWLLSFWTILTRLLLFSIASFCSP